jgi:hypothetical protein
MRGDGMQTLIDIPTSDGAVTAAFDMSATAADVAILGLLAFIGVTIWAGVLFWYYTSHWSKAR